MPDTSQGKGRAINTGHMRWVIRLAAPIVCWLGLPTTLLPLDIINTHWQLATIRYTYSASHTCQTAHSPCSMTWHKDSTQAVKVTDKTRAHIYIQINSNDSICRVQNLVCQDNSKCAHTRRGHVWFWKVNCYHYVCLLHKCLITI